MKIVPALLSVALTLPLSGQYAGPAILSRGEAPAAMTGSTVAFKPFASIQGEYATGLSTVRVLNESGEVPTGSSPSISASWGVSGSRRWRNTTLGLDYFGNIVHYFRRSYYDGLNQSFLLGLTHRLNRHTTLTSSGAAGLFGRNSGLMGLPSTLPFDPNTLFVPSTDFFDNRTIYLSNQTGIQYQKSMRLSFSATGFGFTVRRRSSSLFGANGKGASGDVQYRMSSRSAVGFNYSYTNYSYVRAISDADIHGYVVSYSVRPTRRVEFSGYGGMSRLESKYAQVSQVDPVIAALLGIRGSQQIVHRISWIPRWGARVSRTVHNGVIFGTGGYMVTPGNGLFLLSYSLRGSAGYTYTGLRHWSINAMVSEERSRSVSNAIGRYSGLSGGGTISRVLGRGVSFVAGYTATSYSSSTFVNYNRLTQAVHVGFAFSPGEIPLRIW